MHVTLFGVVLFSHITIAIIGFMMAGIMHAALQAMARAKTVAEVRSWTGAVHLLDPLFPVVALLLIGLGAWLIHLSGGRFAWSDSWLMTSLISLVVVEGLMGALVAPRAKALVRFVHGAADGPISDEIRRVANSPILWHLTHVASFAFIGVVFLMTAHPNAVWSPVIVVVAVLIGLAASQAQLRALPGATRAAVPGQRPQPAETV